MRKINFKSYKTIIENIIFIFSLLISYILHTSSNFFYIDNVFPVMIIAIVISISMFQNIFVTCVYSLFAGILFDMAIYNFMGFSSLIFIIVCSAISMLTIYYIKINLSSFIIFIFILTLIESVSIAFLKYNIVNVTELNMFFINNLLPSILYIIFIGPIIFLFFSYINNNLYNENIF